jgi:hypothetical protein
MIKDIEKTPPTLKVIHKQKDKIQSNTENSTSDSEPETGNSTDSEIQQLQQQFSEFQVNRIMKPKVNPTSYTMNWYPRPTPPDMQYEERNFQNQFSVSSDKLYE